jgi:inward rectifier potassium channel
MSPPKRRRRHITRDGRGTIERVGIPGWRFIDLYHFLLNTRWLVLLGVIAGSYIVLNAFFALGYLAIGDGIENARPGSFTDAFFFSVQTMATIGYGKLVPHSFFANVLVTVEALTGMVGVAMATGLMFAKFARPTARVMFSNVAVVTTYDGAPTLMFRAANERANLILEAQMRVVLTRQETNAEGVSMRRFYDIPLSRSQTSVFTLSWTLMHSIDERSPLHGVTCESMAAVDAEIHVSLMGIDDTFSQTIHARYTYTPDQIVFGARLADVLTRFPDGRRVIDYDHFHDIIVTEKPGAS